MAVLGFLLVNVLFAVIMFMGVLFAFIAPNFNGARETFAVGLAMMGGAGFGFYKLYTDWAVFTITLN